VKRSPLRRGKPLARGKGLARTGFMRRASGRTRNLDRATTPPARPKSTAIPAEVRDLVRARSQGRCEVFDGSARCASDAHHMHHRLPRSRGGEHTADNLLHVCASHHHEIHTHPQWGYQHGYLLRTPPLTMERTPR